MPKKKHEKKGKSSTPREATLPSGPEDVLADVEALVERGERKMRDLEPVKARGFLQQAVQMLRAANLTNDASGCLLLATATGNLLSLDAAEVRAAGWLARGISLPTNPAPMGAQVRLAALELCTSCLENGFLAASAANDPAEERAHLLDTRAQLATLLSEEKEAEAERERAAAKNATEGAAALATQRADSASAAALADAQRALAWWESAGQLLLSAPSDVPRMDAPPVDSLPDDWEVQSRHSATRLERASRAYPPQASPPHPPHPCPSAGGRDGRARRGSAWQHRHGMHAPR